ncbi:hypothetical protein E2K98_13975 [Bacillus salipaludis]|uniref:Uncharacterized protein n=1 Tax=Bacillus salipaludis TaxID=2547811 RepID=A0A4R5VSL6_9BACI|nr:hypothetical protein [Bacillus salipaludis]TDK60830.1 hypothetical protein E2K98_13975 [Bacillus salipaludis]
MSFIGIVIIIVLIYFLIIRPLTRRNRPQIYEPRRDQYDQRGYNGPRNYYGATPGRGFGGFGGIAGGMAAGALLTYLFEQGRIGFDQYHSLQNLEDHEIMRELMDQNILQEHEIDQLQEQLGHQDDNGDWDGERNGDGPNNVDDNDQDNQQNNNDNDFSDWDNGDDNWV